MNRTVRYAASSRTVKFPTVGRASLPLLLASLVLLIGCQPKAQSQKDESELNQTPEVLISSNLEIWDILGRPTSVAMSFDLQNQRESNVLKVSARTERTSCASTFVLPNSASEEEIYTFFAERTASFKCFSATLNSIEADELREVVRVFYLTLFPSVSNTQDKTRQHSEPDRTTASYHFDKLTKTPIYYSWQATEDGCLKQSALKIRGLQEVSGVWNPRSADVVVRLHCNSPAARFFIDVQDTSVRREQAQNQTDDN